MKPYIIPFVITLLLITSVTFAQTDVETGEPITTEPVLEDPNITSNEAPSPVFTPEIKDMKLKEAVDELMASTTLSLEEATKQKLEDANTKQITDLLKEIVDTLHNIERNGSLRK